MILSGRKNSAKKCWLLVQVTFWAVQLNKPLRADEFEQFAETPRNFGIVVLGTPRTGTTLLANIIGAHSGVGMLFEDPHGAAFRLIGGKIPAVKLCIPNQVDLERRWHPFYRIARLCGWSRKNIGYRLPVSRLSLRDMADRNDLKLVCLIRDPNCALDALRRREKLREEICSDMLRRTYRLYETILDEWSGQVCVLSFDRLLRDPEGQTRRLCTRIGLQYEQAMLDAPRFNHLYPEDGFRAERAAPEAADGHAISAGRLRAHPAIWASYLSLLRLAI